MADVAPRCVPIWACVLPAGLCVGLASCSGTKPATAPHPASAFSFTSFKEHRIDDEGLSGVRLRGADGLVATDLDDDGRLDVISVHEDSSHVRIAFGGEDGWTNVTLASGESVGGCEDVAVDDLDADGRTDIVVASEAGSVTVFAAPENRRDVQAWNAQVVPGTQGRGSWIRVKIADLDEDGRPDILAVNKAREGTQGSFSIFHNGGWRETVLARATFPVINARPVDLDGDGDLDVVGASWGDESIWVFERNAGTWTRHLVHSGEPTSIGFMLELADLDGDGLIDIVSGSGPRFRRADQIHWFQQPDTMSDRWRHHLIGGIGPDKATGLELIDLNGDGRDDLFVGGYSWEPWTHEPSNPKATDVCGRLAWFEAPADPTRPWARHDISRRRRGMFDVFEVADVNGDGLEDILTTRGNSGEYDGVIWLEQLRSAQPGPAFVPARDVDSPEIPLP